MALKLFKMCPQAATDFDKICLLQRAAQDDSNDLDFLLPLSTFDLVVAACRPVSQNKSYEGRLRALVDAQCALLSMVLNQDVLGTVYEYLFGVKQKSKPLSGLCATKRNIEQWFKAAVNNDEKLAATLLHEDPHFFCF